jgi:hypothetical protein
LLFQYHRLMIQQILADQFSPAALAVIIKANLWQDNIVGNVFHPEHHFTENKTDEALAYIETQRGQVISTLREGAATRAAWQAFGRLLHTAQDFYAHSNYVQLWLEGFKGEAPPPDHIEALAEALLRSSKLYTCRAYRPLGVLAHVPLLDRWTLPFLPPDAHAHMNLDKTSCGPLFPYALAAAKKRTWHEYQEVVTRLNNAGQSDLLHRFKGL